MIEFINNNIDDFWFILGFILLAVEALALGFSTGFVLFIGLAALMTGGLVWFGAVPDTWIATIATFVVSSVIISVVLWKPFMSMQSNNKVPEKDNSSDLIGLKFRLDEAISTAAPGKTRYSGIDWEVELDFDSDVDELPKGATVIVTSVDTGKFRVKSY